MRFDLSFYRNKKVFLTGHTGFKGSWLSVILTGAGAEVTGYSTCSQREARLFDLCGVKEELHHIQGEIRDAEHLTKALQQATPDIVIHMAAQPIVREGYGDPVKTFSTNIMGTVNLLEAVRQTPSVRSVLNVTTDKVYLNREWDRGYREDDPLDGYDPYSNSKSCSELVTHSYACSFLKDQNIAVSTARAGNVIGGGDFAQDRIIPDCVRAAINNKPIIVRNPASIRPYQHVLEPLFAYLMIAARQYEDPTLAGWYNVGPDDRDCVCTGDLVDLFIRFWGEGAEKLDRPDGGPHEANFLKLDCQKLKETFGWSPRWNISEAVQKTVEWTKEWQAGNDIRACMQKQIEAYLEQ